MMSRTTFRTTFSLSSSQVGRRARFEVLPDGPLTYRKRVAKAIQSRGLKFQGISASMSLLGQRLAMRSNVSLAQA